MIVVDRIEGDRAVLELDGKTIDVPVSWLPEGVGEGAVLRLSVDPDAGARRLAEAEARLARLRARSSQTPDSMDL